VVLIYEGGIMKETLKPGIQYEFKYQVPKSKTVPALYPEAPEFQVMPNVLATGYLVGLIEWTCIQAINPHIDWPREQTVGTNIQVNHTAATPPGMVVTVFVKLMEVDRRRLVFEISVSDGIDVVSKGIHERFVIDAETFVKKIADKATQKVSP
jgi:fluoroacetyl-CoA thioesterase